MTKVAKPLRRHFDREETLSLLRALPALEWGRLYAVADKLALKLAGWNGKDLLHTAINKMPGGKRPWPRAVQLTPFVVKVMQGVIWNERKKLRGTDSLDPDAPIGAATPSPSEILEQEDKERILRLNVRQALARHPNAQAVAIGILGGLEGEELRAHNPGA